MEGIQSGGAYSCTIKTQLEVGSTATTFAPYSNICPITAYTEGEIEVGGKNRFDPSLVQNNKSINASGVITDTLGFGAYGPYRVKSGNDVTFGFVSTNDSTTTRIHGYDSFGNWVEQIDSILTTTEGQKSLTVTIPQNVVFVKVSTRNTFTNMQLETGSTATDYEPYTSITHTTTYPSAIYRGSEDVVKGEVTAERVKVVFDGSSDEDWRIGNTYPSQFAVDVGNYGINLGSASYAEFAISNMYVKNNIGATQRKNGEMTIYNGTWNGTFGIWLAVKDERFTTVEDFKAAIATTPIEFAYELATPTTSSVTPTNLPIRTLSGYNHIESSTGEMEVEYITQDYQPLVDLIEESGGDSHTYSTTEQVVGKWIDGSDVYERTFEFSTPVPVGTSFTSCGVDSTDISLMLDVFGIHEDGTGYGDMMADPTPSNHTLLGLKASDSHTIKTLILRYTKTTTQTNSLSLSNSETDQVDDNVLDKDSDTEDA